MKQEHFEILMEEMNSKFNLVLEGHQSLRTEMGGMRTELKQDIELCNFKIDTLNHKIDGVASDLKETDARLSTKIDGVAADLKATDERLTGKIDDAKEELGNKIDAVAADLKAHRQDTELHHGVYKVKE